MLLQGGNFLIKENNNERKNRQVKIMIYKEISVPSGIRYVSDWSDFTFPDQSCIIDKTICGCGFTEWCLNNDIPVILCSPRKVLLENKSEQHNKLGSNKRPVYYFRNEREKSLEFDSNVNKKPTGLRKGYFSIIELERKVLTKKNQPQVDDTKIYLDGIKSDLIAWVQTGTISNPDFVPKILVTYDSLGHVVDAMGNNINNFVIVVDEFQSIFSDSAFKAEVELGIVDILSTLNVKSIFVSATPMMDRYLAELPYFSGLTMYKLIWDNTLVDKVNICRKKSKSIKKDIVQVIDNYKNGVFPTKVTLDGVEHISKEAVFFVNSVTIICEVLKLTKLTPDEVNILCADTMANQKKLKRLKHQIGKVPTDLSNNKMFTFCTRTTYIGADFYSDNAMTFIFSDLNIQHLTLDISLDLPQIIGRQRLDCNVFRNEIVYYYQERIDSVYSTKEEFLAHVNEKEQITDNFIKSISSVTDTTKLNEIVRFFMTGEKYSKDYIGFSRKYNKIVKNELVKLSELRAFDITRPDYQDNMFVKKCTQDPMTVDVESLTTGSSSKDSEVLLKIMEFKKEFEKDGNFVRRMKLFYSFITKEPTIYQNYNSYFISFVPVEYRNCLNKLGINRIRSLKYKKNLLLNEINKIRLAESGDLKTRIQSEFQLNTFYSLTNIKDKLKKIYEEEGYDSTPKATDLQEYFEVEDQRLTDSVTKKREYGYLIKSLKP